jgi:hypothetical protein
MRCFVFGAIGLIPLAGSGLAVQALRLRAQVGAELCEGRSEPVESWIYWVVGLAVLGAADVWFGIIGALAACVLMLALQSTVIWRRQRPIPAGPARALHPALRQAVLGEIFASAGLAISLWMVGLLGRRLAELGGSL